MERKKSLSPQVEGLFEKVRRQADEYAEAFRLIEKGIRDMERQRHNLEYLINELGSDVNKSIEKNSEKTEENIRRLKEKTNQTLGLYSEIDKVRDLRMVLEDLYENVKSQADELERTIPQFKRKAEKELYNTLVSVKERLDNELASESDRIEEKITSKLRMLEGKFVGYEKRLKGITEHQIEELNRRHINISELNDKIEEMKTLTRKINKMILGQIDAINEEVERKIKEMRTRIDNAAQLDTKPRQEETPEKPVAKPFQKSPPAEIPAQKDYDDQIDDLRFKIKKITELSNSSESKSNIGLWLSGIAFAGIILLLVLMII
jgi:DNA repair exonuclease SbcCD ATPase subunit